MRFIDTITTAFGLVIGANAQNIAQYCPEDDTCFKLHIPEETAQGGGNDIYFQINITASNHGWTALGQGNGMEGAHIFVVYASESGNVTVSPRLGTGYVMPMYDDSTDIEVLEGSEIVDGRIVANVLCRSCQSWDGGSMDFTGNGGDWIYAYWTSEDGPEVGDEEMRISKHDEQGTFRWSFAEAKGGESADTNANNPFLASTAAVEPSAGDTGGTTTTSTGGGGGGGMSRSILLAHGVLASLAFLVFFPVGAMIIRLGRFRGSTWVHAGVQVFAYSIYIAAFGLGLYMATSGGYLNNHHPIIGIVLFCVLFLQPIGGLLHHRSYKKHQKRSIVSYIHVWVGRAAIILGMINGGLGLRLAGVENTGYLAAYGVVAGVIGVAYLSSSAWVGLQRRRTGSSTNGMEEKSRGRQEEEALRASSTRTS